MIAFLKLLTALVIVLVLLFWVLMVFKRHFKSASITLFAEGFILTHPYRKALAFNNAIDAKNYVDTCRKKAGIIWTVHRLYKGKLFKVEF